MRGFRCQVRVLTALRSDMEGLGDADMRLVAPQLCELVQTLWTGMGTRGVPQTTKIGDNRLMRQIASGQDAEFPPEVLGPWEKAEIKKFGESSAVTATDQAIVFKALRKYICAMHFARRWGFTVRSPKINDHFVDAAHRRLGTDQGQIIKAVASPELADGLRPLVKAAVWTSVAASPATTT